MRLRWSISGWVYFFLLGMLNDLSENIKAQSPCKFSHSVNSKDITDSNWTEVDFISRHIDWGWLQTFLTFEFPGLK